MGNVREVTELITPGPAEALAGLLGVTGGSFGEMPLLWHWVYLLDRPPTAALGPDGHQVRDGMPVPPGPGLRRMFAGGRVWRHGALRTGAEATRYSALTYNARRIHYDRDFARAEGYPGLLVHGPLQALLMAELAGRAGPAPAEYFYRLVSPLYDGQGLVVSAAPDGDAVRVPCRDAAGRVTATGAIRG
jgi:hydroxyacyl-ACP dehydratase HTD2-like protein with hotdog domain